MPSSPIKDEVSGGSDTVLSMDGSDAHSGSDRHWHLFGREIPKSEIVFFCQVIILYTVIITSLVNLTTSQTNSNLWTALLSSSLGYLLPNPTIKKKHT